MAEPIHDNIERSLQAAEGLYHRLVQASRMFACMPMQKPGCVYFTKRPQCSRRLS